MKSPKRVKKARDGSVMQSSGPLACRGLDWPAPLRQYQVEGISALVERPALLLADDMGLGKTVQAIGALRVLHSRGQLDGALTVVPASLVHQWRAEIRRWSPELSEDTSTVLGAAADRAFFWQRRARLFLTSYETLRSDFTSNPLAGPRRHHWTVVILDEAQKIKNRDSEVSEKCKQLRRRQAWALTGTPLENSEDELASVLEFVTPFDGKQNRKRLAPGPATLAMHRAVQLRRKKSEVLSQLPPKIVVPVYLELSRAQRAAYNRAERAGVFELRELGNRIRIENVLELILRLKQICNFDPVTGQSSKADDLVERVESLVAEGHKALVFSQFVKEPFGVDAIAKRLLRFRPIVFKGALDSQERETALAEFRADKSRSVLLLSLMAGGLGLNLQEASYVFHFDRWWNPARETQAEDRAHRLGQDQPVHIYKYVSRETIEERIENILQQKRALFDKLVDDVTLDLRMHLTPQELFGLVGLTPPRS